MARRSERFLSSAPISPAGGNVSRPRARRAETSLRRKTAVGDALERFIAERVVQDETQTSDDIIDLAGVARGLPACVES